MSEESTARKPTGAEERLIAALVARSSGLDLPSDWIQRVRVKALDDGQMGSLRLSLSDPSSQHRQLGRIVAELQFTDVDGVEVLVSLSTDKRGELFEIDVWKTNFDSLISFRIGSTNHA